jgi:molybdopterin converting factor subunit 1
MRARALFFGRLAELAGARELTLAIPEGASAGALAAELFEGRPGLAEALALPGVRVAINQAIAREGFSAPVADGDEVAFMPPMSGG